MPTEFDDTSWLLGIPNHRIVGVEELEENEVLLVLERKPRVLKCPRCRSPAPCYDAPTRFIDDLPAWGRRMVLTVSWPRVDCPSCGVLQISYGWVGPTGRRTRRFERWIYELTRWIPVADVAEIASLAWQTVKDIETRFIRAALRGRSLEGITALGIDEVSYRKGHRYLTIVTDVRQRRILDVKKGRDSAALKRFFRTFGPERLAQIREVVIDMHEPYELAIAEAMPHARIVFDRFHLMKLLNRALDELRRRQQRDLPLDDRRVLKNKRYVLLRPREELTPRQRVALTELRRVNEPLSTAYLLKEDFREIYQAHRVGDARLAFADWIRRVRESQIPELVDFVGTLRRHFTGVLGFFRHRLTNGLAEGFNNVIKTIQKVAYGFHDVRYLRLKILRHCGLLRHEPQPTLF